MGTGGLLLGQRVAHDAFANDFGQCDVPADVVEVGAVVLLHQHELLGVAEDDGADVRVFEAGVLLNDGNVPDVELAKLGVAFGNDLLATGDVQEPGDLLVNDSLP